MVEASRGAEQRLQKKLLRLQEYCRWSSSQVFPGKKLRFFMHSENISKYFCYPFF